MARILIDGRVLAHAQTSGVERYVTEICRGLATAGAMHHFEVARPTTRARILQHIWEHAYLSWRCVAAGFDLLFCPANIAPLINGRTKLVVTIHGIAFRYSPQSYSKSFYYYYSYLVPRTLERADAIIAVSNAEKQSILQQYPVVPANRIHVVPNGVDHALFKPGGKEQARAVLQQRYGVNDEFVLGVGSFKSLKNFNKLIDAYLALGERLGGARSGHPTPDTLPSKLVLLSGADAPPVRLPSNVIAIGDVGQEMPSFYQAAACLVCPSLYEGFGFPALEAMACGCPVIASRAGALPEICADAAYYIDAHDRQSIADGIMKVVTDSGLRNDLIERGLCRAREFTWERASKDTLKVFDRVLGAT
jgi:glycosyltransferase involved in cell wall biosynthesis